MPANNNTTQLTFQSTSPNHMFGILKTKKTSKLSQYESVFCLTSGNNIQFTPTKKQTKKRTQSSTKSMNINRETSSDCTKSEISQDSTLPLIISHPKPQKVQLVTSPQQDQSLLSNTSSPILPSSNILTKKVIRTSISIRELLN